MLFKQSRIFQLNDSHLTPDTLIKKLEALEFRPCRPTAHQGLGWVSPLDEENAPLVHTVNGYLIICLQVEEKILPAIVVRQELNKKIKEIEQLENRKVRQKEKFALKDEIILTLLPRAFSKLTRVYAYLDLHNNWLVLGTNNEKRAEQFISLLKKSLEAINPIEINKLSYTMTHWLKNKSYPTYLSVEKSCTLQDPNQQNRIIRCQHQDLFANSIQALIKDGCEVKQLALLWQDHVNFVLADDFSFSGIRFNDEILSESQDIEAETTRQKFFSDFFMMTETFSKLFKSLLETLSVETAKLQLENNKIVNLKSKTG